MIIVASEEGQSQEGCQAEKVFEKGAVKGAEDFLCNSNLQHLFHALIT